MATLVIPLRAGAQNAHSQLTVQLGDELLELHLNYITLAGPAWSMDIYREGVLLLPGVMLEPGVILTEVTDIGIGTMMFSGDEVTLDNLGIANNLVWTNDDV